VYTLELVVIISLAALLFGLGLGVLLGRLKFGQGGSNQLANRLQQAEAELENYQHQVAKHFVDTSQRISDLTQSYRDLHQHLAEGAARLASPDISRKLLEAAEAKSVVADVIDQLSVSLEPPKDWAPKTPGQKGGLSDDFDDDDKKTPPVFIPPNYQP
jgi:uncharacterized membrane-anchored protein YhcB (DUF1043 family)